jgi:uncharacterized protein YciI/GNAT superfamily N-acetyltransferase
MKSFLILLEDKQSQLLNEKLLEDHISYLKKLRQQGFLPICGPKVDNKGGILIIRTDSEEHAQELILNDPFIREGYYRKFIIHEFQEANDDNNWLADSSQTQGNLKNEKRTIYSIQYEKNPTPKDIEILSLGISLNAKAKRGLDPVVPFAFFIRDENNEIKGGCNGNIGYDWLYVDQLWIDESLREQGYGTKLMNSAEALARENKCVSAAVNTGDWEALDFYKKLGFRVELERQGLAKNSKFYFLRKDFVEPSVSILV